MDKSVIYNRIRSSYPKLFGFRKNLQRIKVERFRRQLLPVETVTQCEANPALIHKTLQSVEKMRGGGILTRINAETDSILQNSSFKKNNQDLLRQDINFCRVAYGFLPSEYCGFELEGKSPEQRRSFMSDIDTYIFGYTVNDISFLQRVIDKGRSVDLFGDLFRRDYLVIKSKEDFADFKRFIERHPIFVKKYTNSSMGRNIEKVDIRSIDLPLEKYFSSVIHKGKYLLEELIIQHPAMTKFNETSVNTVRCITLRTKSGIEVPYCFMRVGRKGSFVDNGGAGGILVGVNPLSGVLETDGFDEFNHRFIVHPDSSIPFRNEQIPEWSDMINICRTAAGMIKEMGYLSWDMAYSIDGWKVVEVNGIGQLIGPQMVYKRGIKEEIKEYLKKMYVVI